MNSLILPSGESNFFDYSQISPINKQYPSPRLLGSDFYFLNSGVIYSGIYQTLPSGAPSPETTGIFHYSGFNSLFSNYSQHQRVNDFQIFNPYIHYYPKDVEILDTLDEDNMGEDQKLEIPYISSYRINILPFNPYGPI